MQTAGQPSGRVAVVVEGGLRIVHVETDGLSRVVRLLGPGEHIGDTEFILRDRPAHSAYAMPGTRLCVISLADFDALAAAHPSLVWSLLETAQRRLLATELLLSSQVADDVLTRLVSFLLSLPGTLERTDEGGSRRHIVLPSSQVDVASYLGTTPETLSRRLRRLVDSGAVDRLDGPGAPLRGALAIDVDALTTVLRGRS